MRPDERDAAYLWDMLDAAKSVRDFTSGLDFYYYNQDKKIKLAVERSLEIIGEAASRVSNAFKEAHPEISWRGMKGLRNGSVRSNAAPGISPVLSGCLLKW